MSQINDTMLNMLQEITKLSSKAKPAEKEDPASSPFKDMMDQHREQLGKDTEKDPTAKPAQEPQSEQAETPNQPVTDGDLENRMALAAMALLANPVVPMEDSAPTPVQAPVVPVVNGTVQPEQAAPVVAEAVPQEAQPEQPVIQTQQKQEAMPSGGQELAKPQETAAEPQQALNTQKDGNVQNLGKEQVAVVQKEDTKQPVEVEWMEPAQQRLFKELKSVPVKVGETVAPQQEEQAEGVDKQMMDSLNKALERGESKLEIQLKPHNLGTVKVELTRNADGTLNVVLHAEKSQTQTLLEKNAFQLQSALSNQNQEPVRVVVQQQDNQQHTDDQPKEHHQDGRQQEQQHQQQREQRSQDFIQQLRLGLMPVEPEAT